jgi:hypothetical protein
MALVPAMADGHDGDDGCPPRAPGQIAGQKAAINHLIASGATAIMITEHDGVCSFSCRLQDRPHAVLIQWLPETKARAIIKRAASPRFPARALCRQQQPD